MMKAYKAESRRQKAEQSVNDSRLHVFTFSLVQTRTSPLDPRLLARRGISLMEVLVSIGIVAIGLVSVLSLLPVGGYQAARAETEVRKSTLGQNAVQDLRTRGVLDMRNWVRFEPSSPTTTKWVDYATPSVPPELFHPPLVIDPLMVAAGSSNVTNSNVVEKFPMHRIGGSEPVFKRLTLRQASNLAVVSGVNVYSPNPTLADFLASASDDVVASRPDDSSEPAVGEYFHDNATPLPNLLKRASEGQYTWLITLAPTELEVDHIAPQSRRHYLMSLVIFQRRVIPSQAAFDPTISDEQMANVELLTADGLGGGDMRLYDSAANAEAKLELARGGNWLMLCRYEPTGDLAPGGHPIWPVIGWYRIVSAESSEVPTGGRSGNLERYVTLSGPDWRAPVTSGANAWIPSSPPAPYTYNTYACLFDNIVAVYQRPIWIEGPSQFSQ
jgi:hypothetical protein